MKVIKLIFLVLWSTLSFARASVEATLSPGEVVLGDSLSVVVKVTHEAGDDPFVSFVPVNAEVIGKSESVSTRAFLQGGKLVQERVSTKTYELQPVKLGYVHVRQIKVDIEGSVIRHRSLRAKVVKTAKKAKDFFLRAEVSKEEVFVGEAVDVNYYLYFKRETTMHVIKKFPLLKDFLKRFEIPRAQRERVNVGGELYYRQLMYKARAYPQKSGEVKIDSLTLEFKYADYNRRSRDIFGMSMQFASGRYRDRTLRSPVEKLKVLPLPVEGVPASFTGLVGKHNFNLTIPNTKVIVNDALEARLEVTGEGALEKFDPVRLFDETYFESFDPKTEVAEISALETKKIIDYTFLAQKSGEVQKRVVELSYFDPEKREYVIKELQIPQVNIFGSGSKSETLSSTQEKATKRGAVNVPTSQKADGLKLIGPIYDNERSRLFNINTLNYLLGFIILIAILFPGIKEVLFAKRKFSTLSKKNLNYKGIHDYLVAYFPQAPSLRDRIENSALPPATKLYFKDLLAKAERNEFKNEKNSLKYDKKHIKEAIRVLNESR